jgi:hypothetical protein
MVQLFMNICTKFSSCFRQSTTNIHPCNHTHKMKFPSFVNCLAQCITKSCSLGVNPTRSASLLANMQWCVHFHTYPRHYYLLVQSPNHGNPLYWCYFKVHPQNTPTRYVDRCVIPFWYHCQICIPMPTNLFGILSTNTWGSTSCRHPNKPYQPYGQYQNYTPIT